VCPGYARHCRALSSAHALDTAAGLLEPAAATAGSGAVRAQLAQRRIVRLQQLDEQIAACLTQLTKLVAATRTRLVDVVGIGPLPSARILGEGSATSTGFRPAITLPRPTPPPRSRCRLGALTGTG
jgi:transposase